MERYQKKLIPVNIVVMVLCLVAGFTLIFAPLIQIDLGKLANGFAESVEEGENQENDGRNSEVENDEAEIGVEIGDEEPEESESGESTEFNITKMLSVLEGKKLDISVYTVSKFAFAPNPIDALVDDIVEIIDTSVKQLAANVLIPTVLSYADVDKADYDAIMEKADVERVYDAISGLENIAPSEKDAAIDNLVNVLEDESDASLSEDERAELKSFITEAYDNTAEHNNGEFTVEALICVMASEAMSGGEENEVVYYTTYREIINGFLGSEESNDAMDGLSEMVGVIMELAKVLTIVLLFFPCVWFVLFLFALFHTLAKNKRFMMWYVKLFGGIPCLLFWLLPTVAKAAIPALMEEGGAVIAAALGAISSLTWISGLCYILLWAVSIFWAFPIKRKIRKMRSGDLGDVF